MNNFRFKKFSCGRLLGCFTHLVRHTRGTSLLLFHLVKRAASRVGGGRAHRKHLHSGEVCSIFPRPGLASPRRGRFPKKASKSLEVNVQILSLLVDLFC